MDRLDKLCGQQVGPEGRWDIFQLDYLDVDGQEKRIIPKTIWQDKEFANEAGTLELKELFGKRIFDNPKPSALIRHCIEYCSEGDDLILDFFAGSCSAAQAVIEQNIKDGKRRRFIMLQLPELCDEKTEAFKAGFKNIADIGKERIRLVGAEVEGGGFVDRGFRVFELDRSNFRVWEGDAEQAGNIEKQLEMHVEHISPESGAEDVLYELLLKAGFPLSTHVQTLEMAGKQVFFIEEGTLLICLEKEVTPELIDALAEAGPLQVICLDAAFKGNDQLKANAVQTFKARAKSEESEIVFKTV